jgi:hypothetical protein
MTEHDIATLNAQAIAQTEAEDPAIIEEVLSLMVAGRRTAGAIHRALIENEEFSGVSEAAVRKILGTPVFVMRYAEAVGDPEAYVRTDIKRSLPRHWRGVKALASDKNEDKRTRTANLHFAMGVAGISPTQKVEAGEELLQLARLMFPGKAAEAGAPPAPPDGTV